MDRTPWALRRWPARFAMQGSATISGAGFAEEKPVELPGEVTQEGEDPLFPWKFNSGIYSVDGWHAMFCACAEGRVSVGA